MSLLGEIYATPSRIKGAVQFFSRERGQKLKRETGAGVMLITLITSMLSIMQAPDAAKQIIYGVVIIVMVGFYSRRLVT